MRKAGLIISIFLLNIYSYTKNYCLYILKNNKNLNLSQAMKISNLILKYSDNYEIDPEIILSIMKQESNFNHKEISNKGAIGVMQLMPSTAKELGVNPYVLGENIKGGVIYYSRLYKKYNNHVKALAAYNAGEGRLKYEKWKNINETRNYVVKVGKEYIRFKKKM